VSVRSGRYGAYIKHLKTNATLPKGTEPADLTMEDALVLLAEKAAKSKPAKAAKKPAAKKAKKAKKPAKRKTAAAKKPATPALQTSSD
jgi:DNA topoisomerase-1